MMVSLQLSFEIDRYRGQAINAACETAVDTIVKNPHTP
jgi:hypothetical protein